MQLVNWHDDTLFRALRPLFRGERGVDPRRSTGHAFDVETTEDGIRVKTILPGYGPEDVDIDLEGEVLRVTTRKPGETADDGATARSATRALRLPFAIDADKVEAELARGVLSVWLPRRAEDKPRRIAVQGEGARL